MYDILEKIKNKLTIKDYNNLVNFIEAEKDVAQITGYNECENGNIDIQTLCSNMGLKKDEFKYMTEHYPFVIDPYIKEIKLYLEK